MSKIFEDFQNKLQKKFGTKNFVSSNKKEEAKIKQTQIPYH